LNTKEIIQDLVSGSIDAAVKDGRLPSASYPVVKIEYPKDPAFGDYSCPVALESARVLKRSPLDIGSVLGEYIEKNDIIDRVEIAKPGFINMFISYDYLFSNLLTVIDQGKMYGTRTSDNPRKINIEFVSANPTGPMNIVSARAAAIGDTLANLLEATGDHVDREFYINDYGNQVAMLGRSVLERIKELHGGECSIPEDGYHGEYVRDIAEYIDSEFSGDLESLDSEEERIDFASRMAVEYNVSRQKKDLEDFNVNFRTWFSERTLHENGDVEKTFEFLDKQDVVYEQEGKRFFRSTDYSDDKDRVIIRDDGRPTYLLADIAYHMNKINRGYDELIDIWGPDHHGYIARLTGAVRALGYPEDHFRIIIAQQVNLLMEGETVKMSKRLGRFSTMRELIDEIGVDVARYFFIMRSLDSHLDFDLSLAKKESSENPVFYLQYAHARICSIFTEAAKRGYSYEPVRDINRELDSPEAITLLKLLLKYPEDVAETAGALEPHRITTFLMRLAQSFHRFYTEHRVLTEDTDRAFTLMTLADAVRTVMKNGLNLIGVTAPERM